MAIIVSNSILANSSIRILQKENYFKVIKFSWKNEKYARPQGQPIIKDVL